MLQGSRLRRRRNWTSKIEAWLHEELGLASWTNEEDCWNDKTFEQGIDWDKHRYSMTHEICSLVDTHHEWCMSQNRSSVPHVIIPKSVLVPVGKRKIQIVHLHPCLHHSSIL